MSHLPPASRYLLHHHPPILKPPHTLGVLWEVYCTAHSFLSYSTYFHSHHPPLDSPDPLSTLTLLLPPYLFFLQNVCGSTPGANYRRGSVSRRTRASFHSQDTTQKVYRDSSKTIHEPTLKTENISIRIKLSGRLCCWQ